MHTNPKLQFKFKLSTIENGKYCKNKTKPKKNRLLRTGAPTEDICGTGLVCTIYCFIAGYDFQVELFFSTKIRDVLCGFVFRLRVHIGCNLEKYSALPAFFFCSNLRVMNARCTYLPRMLSYCAFAREEIESET